MVIYYGDGFLEEVFCRIFRTFLMNILNDSFTAHLGLPFFLARCILLTGVRLIQTCTSPLIRTLRFDSPDWQLQCGDTGGTVSRLVRILAPILWNPAVLTIFCTFWNFFAIYLHVVGTFCDFFVPFCKKKKSCVTCHKSRDKKNVVKISVAFLRIRLFLSPFYLECYNHTYSLYFFKQDAKPDTLAVIDN